MKDSKKYRLVKEIRFRRLFCGALSLTIAATAFRQIITWFLGETVNVAAQLNSNKMFQMLGYLVIGIIVMLVLDYAKKYLYGVFTYKNIYEFRNKTVKAIVNSPLLKGDTTGDLVSRITTDIQKLESFFHLISRIRGINFSSAFLPRLTVFILIIKLPWF